MPHQHSGDDANSKGYTKEDSRHDRRRDDYEGGRYNREDGRRNDKDDRDGRRGGGRRDYDSERTRREEPRWGKERDQDYDRDRGNREKHRARERDRERAGPSRRSASPPVRSDRQQRCSASRSNSPPPVDKSKPNFAASGLLAAETNTVKAANGTSTVLKYNEPPEARKPILGWRLYVFKGSEQVEMMHIHRQSAYLIGRDRLVADIPIEHPSCSKQHCVIQYRHIKQKDELGNLKGIVKPFIIDLESTNGTHVNDERIPESRFYELKAGDVLKFGQSNREYVILHDEAS